MVRNCPKLARKKEKESAKALHAEAVFTIPYWMICFCLPTFVVLTYLQLITATLKHKSCGSLFGVLAMWEKSICSIFGHAQALPTLFWWAFRDAFEVPFGSIWIIYVTTIWTFWQLYLETFGHLVFGFFFWTKYELLDNNWKNCFQLWHLCLECAVAPYEQSMWECWNVVI